jgi:very-short-patch-repair endonuclease
MYKRYNVSNKPIARVLRKNLTPEECKLWYDFLRAYPVKILRQKPIDDFIADFYCSSARLVIEIDGHQHFTENGRKYDEERTQILQAYGLSVLRFSNEEVNNHFRQVCKSIDDAIRECADNILE